MKISDILKKDSPTVSFELFPPKTQDGFDSVANAAAQIAELHPDFMSITYGAGGGTSANTVKIASMIQQQMGVTALAHLTCLSSVPEQIASVLGELKALGVQNVLALRGDPPANAGEPPKGSYSYAYQLVEQIKATGDFCIGAACYPEGHVQCLHKADDLQRLRQKVDCGCDFLTTQMFFDNNILYNFLYRIREAGITVPVLAGIMPVTNSKQITRICQLSGTALPERFKRIVDRFGDNPTAMQQAGVAYATEQIIDLLANGVKGIHIYSMNKPEIARGIMGSLSAILQ
ncbi:MAG: methylenetetrahydrofolate reductase [NAD(P)H] [Angelakisella sp.]